MHVLTILLLPLAWCNLVTAGGNESLEVFFCMSAGCAANVTRVYCNDNLLNHSRIPDCSGRPPPNTVCQHDGRAFVSTSRNSSCEFEGEDQIKTKKCTDHSDICSFMNVPEAKPDVDGHNKYSVKCSQSGSVFGVLLALLVSGLAVCFCKKKQNGEQNQHEARYSAETEQLSGDQSSRDTRERRTDAGPGLDNDTSPSRTDAGPGLDNDTSPSRTDAGPGLDNDTSPSRTDAGAGLDNDTSPSPNEHRASDLFC